MSSSGFERENRLMELAIRKNDSTIFACLQNGRKFSDPIEVTMEKIIFMLAKEKQDIRAAYQAQLNLNPRRESKP